MGTSGILATRMLCFVTAADSSGFLLKSVLLATRMLCFVAAADSSGFLLKSVLLATRMCFALLLQQISQAFY